MQINKKLQSVDPAATIVGADRVHPQNGGHFVMAYNILDKIEDQGTRSSIKINAKRARVVESLNCAVDQVECDGEEVAFRVNHHTLPMPIINGYEEVNRYLPFAEDYNREELSIDNLPKGDYQLSIDGVVVDTLSSSDLGRGVDLVAMPLSPRLGEAQRVMELINDYAAAQSSLRLIANVEHRLMSEYRGGESLQERGDYLADLIEQNRGGEYYEHQLRQRERYLTLKPDQKRFVSEMERLHREKMS